MTHLPAVEARRRGAYGHVFFAGVIRPAGLSKFAFVLLFLSWLNHPSFAEANEILRVDYESGAFSVGSGLQHQPPEARDSMRVDCTTARKGNCSLRTELRRTGSYISFGSYRAEADTLEMSDLRYSIGERYRYRFSFKTDGLWRYDNRRSIDIIWQFKRVSAHADMFVALKGRDLVLRVLASDQHVLLANFPSNTWIDLVIEVFWSDKDNGRVEVLLRKDGQDRFGQVALIEGANVLDARAKSARVKWGLYKPGFAESDDEGPRVVFHDEIMVERLGH